MTYAVGDIHGCFYALKSLLEKLPLSEEDELIFMGDYVDRGPNSREVIEFLIELSKHHRCIFLRGNHEEMLLNCVKNGSDCDLWFFNGARSTVESFGGVEEIKKFLPFFENTVYHYEKENYVFVHGGVRPGVSLEDQDPFDLVWIRDEFIYSENPLPGKIVVFGHTPFEEPFVSRDKIGIDTGCVYGGRLTALRVEDRKFFQVECANRRW
ncbi:metallophosphatase [Thermotoga maritima MSB8]|uniref:Serine/threonine protein phosphatase n=1 Tax=Thermotoga maritima (strain ATCC 43589 / DSM 3109 / JCM 10099 / NBRC 100826 / MSB8) TaxID=243274 RepID=Q9WZK1_THEMA|nr:metallophosphoesterase family protein [Thermotoga maritima]AAD35823.1 serine/threonine protein phosphatase [Thermotoga maritima MSB8]AGL49668.1 Serine/threonine protein phosphatase [Thermotoga maritima MSB8]AHD17503.1 metallophosphatase [Thermotoga maritima MSB8]AKE26659.1 metallophosphatase [Thermotoga maritima]AKE28523.1 metallophosphatase [Thermotoga maritima MSB8]